MKPNPIRSAAPRPDCREYMRLHPAPGGRQVHCLWRGPELREQRGMASEFGPQRTVSTSKRAVPSSLPRLHEIHVPTLILVGDADIPDVHAHAGAIETAIPNLRRIVISDVGHLIYIEKPEGDTSRN